MLEYDLPHSTSLLSSVFTDVTWSSCSWIKSSMACLRVLCVKSVATWVFASPLAPVVQFLYRLAGVSVWHRMRWSASA